MKGYPYRTHRCYRCHKIAVVTDENSNDVCADHFNQIGQEDQYLQEAIGASKKFVQIFDYDRYLQFIDLIWEKTDFHTNKDFVVFMNHFFEELEKCEGYPGKMQSMSATDIYAVIAGKELK